MTTVLFIEDSTLQSMKMPFIILVAIAFFSLKLLMLRRERRLPPGPPKLPIIGNMNKLMGPAPHRSLRDLARQYGPLMHLKLGSVSTIIVSSAEMAKEIMKTKDLVFASRPKLVAPKILGYNYTDVAFAPYGAYWKQLRKICIFELLNPKRLKSFQFVRQEEVADFIRSIASTCPEPVNVAERLFVLNHDITTRIIFGKKFGDQKRFRDAMKEGTALAAGFQIGDFFPSLGFVSELSGMNSRLKKNFFELDSITSKIIEEHYERSKINKPEIDDLVEVLLRLKDSGELEVPITVDNIKSVILVSIPLLFTNIPT